MRVEPRLAGAKGLIIRETESFVFASFPPSSVLRSHLIRSVARTLPIGFLEGRQHRSLRLRRWLDYTVLTHLLRVLSHRDQHSAAFHPPSTSQSLRIRSKKRFAIRRLTAEKLTASQHCRQCSGYGWALDWLGSKLRRKPCQMRTQKPLERKLRDVILAALQRDRATLENGMLWQKSMRRIVCMVFDVRTKSQR